MASGPDSAKRTCQPYTPGRPGVSGVNSRWSLTLTVLLAYLGGGFAAGFMLPSRSDRPRRHLMRPPRVSYVHDPIWLRTDWFARNVLKERDEQAYVPAK